LFGNGKPKPKKKKTKKVPNNGDIIKILDEMEQHEVDEVFQRPIVQEILKKNGKPKV